MGASSEHLLSMSSDFFHSLFFANIFEALCRLNISV